MGKFLLVGLLVTVVGYFFIFPHLFYCQTIRFSDFEKINPTLYVSPGLPKAQRVPIYRAIHESRQRVASLWGAPVGQPTLILCSSPQEYEKYCHSREGAGCSLGTPWGTSYIVLNPYGLNVDVISHEMCHDELFSRLGWWKTTTQVPQWFNEGLALMLDRRFVESTQPVQRYLDYREEWLYLTHGAQEILELKNIESMKGFFNGNQQHVMLAYVTAGLEVSYWLARAGKEGVAALTQQLDASQVPFEEAYEAAATHPKAARLSPQVPENPLRPKVVAP
ncbi:hypothetical protein HNQ92_003519 [Rhabdobacter roseus]|uniref:DUF1570 domain-containing protein n=1 Tax=Rhabdobacter roseus TaxID=1655419 RepID=A0A840TUW1_9BACT|nr:hypothetical protein [Rhabdobacter roseus]MBB5285362.1 hypothetical protein [Rhabdobacter roseus]